MSAGYLENILILLSNIWGLIEEREVEPQLTINFFKCFSEQPAVCLKCFFVQMRWIYHQGLERKSLASEESTASWHSPREWRAYMGTIGWASAMEWLNAGGDWDEVWNNQSWERGLKRTAKTLDWNWHRAMMISILQPVYQNWSLCI